MNCDSCTKGTYSISQVSFYAYENFYLTVRKATVCIPADIGYHVPYDQGNIIASFCYA